MNIQQNTRITLAALAVVLAAACGSGGGSPTAGIDRTGGPATASYGTVTSFGSVVVNGIRYETNGATFTIEGRSGGQDDLSVGDVVLVNGSLNTAGTAGTATSVSFDDNVEGPIADPFDPATNSFVVLGQTIHITPDTSIDDSLVALAAGVTVEVSGFVGSTGDITATRIESRSLAGELEVTGIVSGINAGTSRFMINALVVDFTLANVTDFPGGDINDDDLVEVKGLSFNGLGELEATSVEFKGAEIGVAQGDHVEIEGLITRFVDITDFDVSGYPVTSNQNAVEGGVAGDLGINIKVEVEGELNGAGVLVADKVDIRRAAAVRIEAAVDSVDPGNNSFVVLGITVTVDSLTRMEDKLADVEPFSLTDLVAGNFVEVRGTEFPAGSGNVLAGLLERDDPDDTSIRGFVESGFVEPSFSILGVVVNTVVLEPGATTFRDVDESPLTPEEFFGRLSEGDLVEAQGAEVADQVNATEVEFELE